MRCENCAELLRRYKEEISVLLKTAVIRGRSLLSHELTRIADDVENH